MARLRLNCSLLRGSLGGIVLEEGTECDCGEGPETVEHYFEHCHLWWEQRNVLRLKLNKLLLVKDRQQHLRVLDILGDTGVTKIEWAKIRLVQNYIVDTKESL